MRWRNIDAGQGYYYVTATFTEWLPLLRREEPRGIVVEEIAHALGERQASLAAIVLMPEHLHLLLHLPGPGLLHEFCKHWRGRSARRISTSLEQREESGVLAVLRRHANGRSHYAVWKEQVRALPIYRDQQVEVKTNYIHSNPIRRELVSNADGWPYSSFRYYWYGEEAILPITPVIR